MDLVEAAADRLALYDIRTMTKEVGDLARCLVSSAEHVLGAVVRHPQSRQAQRHPPALHRDQPPRERRRRASCARALARLFREEKDPIAVIKWKEIYETLEIGDRPLRGRRQHHRGRRPRER